jgi:hypothetical protein
MLILSHLLPKKSLLDCEHDDGMYIEDQEGNYEVIYE